MFVQVRFETANGKVKVKCYNSWGEAEQAVKRAIRSGKKARIIPQVPVSEW